MKKIFTFALILTTLAAAQDVTWYDSNPKADTFMSRLKNI
jgi:hypothetical protein